MGLRWSFKGRSEPLTWACALLESYLLPYAPEEARIEGTIVDMDAYRQQVESAA